MVSKLLQPLVTSRNLSYLLVTFLLFTASTPSVTTYEQLVTAIRQTRAESEQRIEAAVEAEKVREAYETGKLIDQHILQHKERAEYGKQVLVKLAKDLGTSETELGYMVEFSRAYPISQPAGKLSWSHYASLLALNDPEERKQVEEKASRENWTRQQLREEIRKRKSKPPLSLTTDHLSLPEATPGKVGVYRIVRALEGPYKNDLVLDLGFSNYFKMGNMDEFKENDLVYVKPVKQSKKGLATRFQFEKVITAPKPEEIHISTKKNPIYGDANMLFTYEAYVKPEWVVDADTFHALIDLGFGFTTKQKLRLKGLDAPEIESKEGKEAKLFLEKQFSKAGHKILIKTLKSDKYDRYLADVWVGEEYLNQELINKQFAQIVNE